MSNIESDSSDFWNLGKKSNNLNYDTESSDFWNLSKKKHSRYSSESFSTESDENDSETNNPEQETSTNKKSNSKSKNKSSKNKSKQTNPTKIEDIETSETPQVEENKKTKIQTEQNDLTSVKIDNKTSELPPNKIIYKNKTIGDFTIKEFYSNFMKSIIDIIKSLKQGKGLNEIFKDKDKLIHFGIALIIISLLLVPLTLK